MQIMFFDMFKKIFQNDIQREMQMAAHEALVAERERVSESRRQSDFYSLEGLVGKPVICISNEWENPVVGVAQKVDFITKGDCPVLVVKDYFSNEEKMIMGKSFLYTEQRFNAVFKLSPFELCSLIYGYIDDFDKEKKSALATKDEYVAELKKNGFFEVCDEFVRKENRKPPSF